VLEFGTNNSTDTNKVNHPSPFQEVDEKYNYEYNVKLQKIQARKKKGIIRKVFGHR
jgi:hypothetical protein